MTIPSRLKDTEGSIPQLHSEQGVRTVPGANPPAQRTFLRLKMVFTFSRGYEEAGVVRGGWELLTDPVKV